MSTQRKGDLPSGLDRRQLLARAVWGTVGLTAATTGISVAVGAPAAIASTKAATYDVACLLNTFTPIVAEGATDPATDFRGTTFFVEGELYPGGAIPSGIDDFDPASIPAIGHWLCRGWFLNRSNRPGETDRPEPHVVTHQEYLFSRISDDNIFPADQLTSSGLEGDNAGRTALRSVVGGAGKWHGASGSVLQHVIGANTTGGPNFRFDFNLARKG